MKELVLSAKIMSLSCLIPSSVYGAPGTGATRPGYWEKDQAKMKGWVEAFGCDMPMRTWAK
jgi:hypothetical protein